MVFAVGVMPASAPAELSETSDLEQVVAGKMPGGGPGPGGPSMGPLPATTAAFGEEGGPRRLRGGMTTLALGEGGGNRRGISTAAFGEE
jgi:hypothetical protein